MAMSRGSPRSVRISHQEPKPACEGRGSVGGSRILPGRLVRQRDGELRLSRLIQGTSPQGVAQGGVANRRWQADLDHESRV